MITLPTPPARIARLPRNQAGYPVPWFVAWFDDVPEDIIFVPSMSEVTVPHPKYIKVFQEWFDDDCRGGFGVE